MVDDRVKYQTQGSKVSRIVFGIFSIFSGHFLRKYCSFLLQESCSSTDRAGTKTVMYEFVLQVELKRHERDGESGQSG